VRQQALPLGFKAKEAIAILVVLVILLSTGWVPSAVAGVICAVGMVLLGVLTVPQSYKGIDWNTCILVGGMIPLATAMTQTGAADLPKNLVLLGLIGLLDPPRQEAIEAVKECHGGGIRVTMITGDHKITAAAIAKRLGIGDGKTAITGSEIEDMDTATLQERVRDVDVFARASPAHKIRLVNAIQAHKQIVAMTGDG
jgi:magnesium-transporting ATPase (P-type)